MKLHFHAHEDADRILDREDYVRELTGALAAINWPHIVTKNAEMDTPRAGAQTAINLLIHEQLKDLAWTTQPQLFSAPDKPGWTMDFHKGIVGVEVVFNNDQYMPWALDRLMLARRDATVQEEHRIRVGVVVVATKKLKKWGKFDDTCATYEKLRDVWLPHLAPILTFPIWAIGIDAAQGDDEWDPDESPFRGTTKGLRAAGLAAMEAGEASDDELDDEPEQED